MSDLKEMLAKFDADIKEATKVKPQQFDIVQVATMISSLPQRKWNAAQARVDATIAKKNAQANLKALKASKMLEARNRTDLKAAPDRQAWVDSHQAVQFAEVELITADAEETAAELAYGCLSDLFDAWRKIMNYLIDQERATKEYDRFANDARRNA